MNCNSPTALYRLWNLGQHHLAAGRYIPARTALQAAADLAWRERDPASLARIHLPLLEAARQIRQAAVEGPILITAPNPHHLAQTLQPFLHHEAATLLLSTSNLQSARPHLTALYHAARRSGHCLEALLLLTRRGTRHLAAPAAPHTTLPITFTTDPASPINPSTDPHLTLPLPPPGLYSATDPATAPLQALARESLLIAWEALALRWQSQHPIRPTPWHELAWLRRALTVDPACEPVAMCLINLAESLARL